MRNRIARLSLIATLTAAFCTSVPSAALAQDEGGKSGWLRGTEIGVDVILIRPLNAVTWVAGLGFIVPASFLAAPASEGTKDDVVDTFWTIPTQNLFQRKLGEL